MSKKGSAADFHAGNDGFWAVTSDTTIIRRIEVSGDVKLILCDNTGFKVPGGIHVKNGDSLTIYAQSAGSGTVTYSPLTYCYKAAASTDVKLQSVAKAIYLYPSIERQIYIHTIKTGAWLYS